VGAGEYYCEKRRRQEREFHIFSSRFLADCERKRVPHNCILSRSSRIGEQARQGTGRTQV
jgi:hypothetical protein